MIDDRAQEAIREAYERTVLNEEKDWISKIRNQFINFDTDFSNADFNTNGYGKEHKEIDKLLEKIDKIFTSILKKERSK